MLKKLTLLQLFILKGIVLFIAWQVVYSLLLEPKGTLDYPLTQLVSEGSASTLRVFGVPSSCEPIPHHSGEKMQGLYLLINGVKSVGIGNTCNGLEVMALFIGFILIVPGKWSHKFLYLFIGLGLIYGANIIRVILLGYNYMDNPQTFDFNHKYTYKIAVYAVVFSLWVIWVEKLSGIKWQKEAK